MGVWDLLDLALVTLLLWVAFAWLRRTAARPALVGVALVGGVTLTASRFGLDLTAWLLQGVAAGFLLLVVVLFQDDLRRAFEQIGRLGMRPRRALSPGAVGVVVRSVERLARERSGALLVVPGAESLDRWLEGGTPLSGFVSEALLLSLFDENSDGHDGAVVLRGNRVARFGVHLPLSHDRERLGERGTRHAAALGLAERSDALCIAVSEERGTISVARDGALVPVTDAADLERRLRPFLERSQGARPGVQERLRRRLPEGLAAVAVALVLWFLLVPGARVVEVERKVPVQIENLPEGYALEAVEPEEVTVRLRGERRRLVLGDLDAVAVSVDAFLARLGRRTYQLSLQEVSHPEGVEVIELAPRKVRIRVQEPDEP